MNDYGKRSFVAWDIETTGFAWDDEITVSGFWLPDGRAKLILNTSGNSVDGVDLEQSLSEVSGGVPVEILRASSGEEVLEKMARLVFDFFDREYNTLVAYNAESWKGGFDLPFVRTRCVLHGVDWVFDGVQFADLWEPVKKRLNTTFMAHGKSDSVNSLTGSHRLLADGLDGLASVIDTPENHVCYGEHCYDPFADSGSAASHYDRGEYLPVCQHNLADIHRTWEIGQVLREYVSSKDISTKKL